MICCCRAVRCLSVTIVYVESNVVGERAQIVDQNIRSENGIDNAIVLIKSYVAEFKKKLDSVF